VSIVNDMLNDLEKRRGEQAKSAVNIDWMVGEKQATKNRYFKPLLWLASGLVFLAIATGVWRNINAVNTEAVEHLSNAGNIIKAADSPMTVQLAETSESNEERALAESEVAKSIVAKPIVAKPTVSESSAIVKASVLASEGVTLTNRPAQVTADSVAAVDEKISQPNSLRPTEKSRSVATMTSQNKVAKIVRAPTPRSFEQRDRSAFKKAEELIRDKQLAAAEQVLVNETTSNPQAVRSGTALSSLLMAQRRFEEAQELLVYLLRENPDSIELIKTQARLFLVTIKPRKAMDLLMKFSPPMSAHSDYYELLGLSARQEQQYELSVQAYKGLLRYNASRGDWWVGMAIALDMQGEIKAARSAYRSALRSKKIAPTLRDYAQQRLSAL
jgi:MSHA biogenesis protein MshN